MHVYDVLLSYERLFWAERIDQWKLHMTISQSIRQRLITLARTKSARISAWSQEMPTEWNPTKV